jgi:HK97 gp10 family phage protein
MADKAFEMDLSEWEGPLELLALAYSDPGLVTDELKKASVKAARIGERGIQSEIANQSLIDTGRMYRSIQGKVLTVSDTFITVEFSSDVFYTGFQNDGTRFIPAHHFFEQGIAQVEPEMNEVYEVAAANISRKLEGK